jgi:hypothetical protein
MALTPTQRLAIKRHLGEHPKSTIMDPLITSLEDGASVEAELVEALTDCNAALAAIATAQDEADELTFGEGAQFRHAGKIAIKKQRYREAVENLARLIGWAAPEGGRVTGFLAL